MQPNLTTKSSSPESKERTDLGNKVGMIPMDNEGESFEERFKKFAKNRVDRYRQDSTI